MDDDPEELQFENVVDPRLAILIVWVIFFCIFIILPSFCIRCLGCCIVVNDNPNDGYGYTTEARILRFGEGNREDREAGMELAYRTLERYHTLSSASKKEVDVMRGGVLRRYLKRCSMMCSLEERSEMMEVEKRKMEAGDGDADAALVTVGSTSDELSLEDANNNDDPDVYIHCLSISESDEVHNDEEAARPSSSSSSSPSRLMANTDDDIHHSIKPSEASSSAVEQQQQQHQHQQQQQQQYPTIEKNENEEHTHTHVRIPFPGYYRDGTKIEEKEPSVADSDDDNEDDVNGDDDEGDNEASNNNSNWRFSLSSFFRAQVQAAADAETEETTVTTTTTNTTPIEGNDASSSSALSNENNNELRHDDDTAAATNNNNNNAVSPPSPNPNKEHDDERPPMPTTTTMITRNVPAFCAICLGEYEHSDIISWSSNPKCTHVFHQECIVTWLTALGRRKGFKYYANGDDDRRRRGGQRGGRQGQQQQQQQRSLRDNSTEEDMENGLYLLNYDLECPCCRQDFILTENVVVLEEGEEEVGIVGSSGGIVETVNCDNGRGDENV